MAKRGRPPKIKPVEEVVVNEETLLAEVGDGVLAAIESAVEKPSVKLEWGDYRNLFDAACSFANTLIRAQGKIHGDTAAVVINLVNDLNKAFPRE